MRVNTLVYDPYFVCSKGNLLRMISREHIECWDEVQRTVRVHEDIFY